MAHKRSHQVKSVLLGAFLLLVTLLVRANADGPTPATPPAPKTATYVGPALCKGCHAKVYEAWAPSPHGKAAEEPTLSANLKGCESCHGPASLHVPAGAAHTPPIPKATDQPGVLATCGACHFTNTASAAPPAWQTLSSQNFLASAHGRKGLSCLSCHAGHPNGNESALIKPVSELCVKCHPGVMEDQPGKQAAYTHMPVAQGMCTLCHAPHGGANGNMVVKDVSNACRQCHDPADAAFTQAHQSYSLVKANCVSCHDPHSHDKAQHLVLPVQHKPYQTGNCAICHTKAEAGAALGLVKPVKELCAGCHPAETLMPKGNNAHPPVKAGLCLSCHNPHLSMEKGLLKDKPRNLCVTCHRTIATAMASKYKHQVLENSGNCMLCHQPHSSPQASLLKKDQVTLCGQCHKHTFSHPMEKKKDGTPVLDPNTKTPVVCSSCHSVHGSENKVMTIADKDRELCMKCHNVDH